MDENIQRVIAPNNCTVGDTYYIEVVARDETKHTVAFYIGQRSGATGGMIKETINHFGIALDSLANGSSVEHMNIRTDNGVSEHGESRVAIWVKAPGVPVLISGGMRFIQVNVFTEDTSAQDFIDAVYGHVNKMAEIVAGGAVMEAKPRQQSTPKPKSALDEYFPRDENGKPDGIPPATTTTRKASTNGVFDLDYDYKEREQYEEEYAGKKVRVLVGKIQWVVATKKDKSGSYEQIQVFKEAHHERPIYDLSVWPHDETKDFSDGKTLVNSLPAGALMKAGDFVVGNIWITYKINPSEKHGKVFWNIQSVDHDIVEAPTQQEASQDGSAGNADDVPF